MSLTGVVREYHAEAGWGVIDADEVPGGCWVHFSVLELPGYRMLSPGAVVSFEAERANQDGYAFRAVRVWLETVEPPRTSVPRSVAYRSELTLTFDGPPESARPED
jgi:cold shock protein